MSALTYRQLSNEIEKMTDAQKDSDVLVCSKETKNFTLISNIEYRQNSFVMPDRPVLVDQKGE